MIDVYPYKTTKNQKLYNEFKSKYLSMRIEIGKQRFIQPVASTIDMSDVERANHLASQATQSQAIRDNLIKLLLADENEGKKMSTETDAYYEKQPAQEKAAYLEAKSKLRKLLLQETMMLHQEVETLATG